MIVDKEIINPYGFIYITTNLLNGKKYIGKRRFSGNWKSYLGSGIHLKEAIKKYGRSNFSKVIVDIGYSDGELNEKEMNLIKFFNADNSRDYYNISKGGCIEGKSGSEAYWYGKHIPKEIVEKANLKRNKKVYQFDLDNNFIREYKSVTQASKENGVSKQGISKSCNDYNKSCGGYFWSYKKDIKERRYDYTKNHNTEEILQYDGSGKVLLNIYSSLKIASEETNIDKGNISACCLGKRKYAGGFIWRKRRG